MQRPAGSGIHRNLPSSSECGDALDAALNGISQALLTLDADFRITFVSEAYRRMFVGPRELLNPGTPVRKMLDYLEQCGEYDTPEARAYLEARTKAISERRPLALTRPQSDGTVLHINGTPLKSGGYSYTFRVETGVNARPGPKATFSATRQPNI